jgi:predicted Kef-type K+ transport protein
MTTNDYIILGMIIYAVVLAFLIGAIADNVRNSDKE